MHEKHNHISWHVFGPFLLQNPTKNNRLSSMIDQIVSKNELSMLRAAKELDGVPPGGDNGIWCVSLEDERRKEDKSRLM